MISQPQALLDILAQWYSPLQGRHIAIDGKTLRGATVIIDVMGTRTGIATQIHQAEAEYVLALKANQKGALEAVAAAFVAPAKAPAAFDPNFRLNILGLLHA